MKKKAKITLEEAFSNYYEFSGLLSSNARNLCYAGIAVIWVFKTGINPAIELPPALIFALLFFVASLLMDIFQYAWSTIWWGKTSYSNEKLKKRKFSEPRGKSRVAECFLVLKTLFLLCGYVFIVYFFCNSLNWHEMQKSILALFY